MPMEMLPEMLELAKAGEDTAEKERATREATAARLRAEMKNMGLTFQSRRCVSGGGGARRVCSFRFVPSRPPLLFGEALLRLTRPLVPPQRNAPFSAFYFAETGNFVLYHLFRR